MYPRDGFSAFHDSSLPFHLKRLESVPITYEPENIMFQPATANFPPVLDSFLVLLQPLIHSASQIFPASVESGLNRRDRHVQNLTNFLQRHIMQIPQDDDRFILIWQSVDGFPYLSLCLGYDKLSLRQLLFASRQHIVTVRSFRIKHIGIERH